MVRTPFKPNQSQSTHPKTPHSKNRLQFHSLRTPQPSPNPNAPLKDNPPPSEHPVEVVGRIRNYPEKKDKPLSVLQVNSDGRTLRVRSDVGYRDFSFDGISLSEEDDLDGFYRKFVESRINGVKLGANCTIMMYGPTGSGKSHTMFGCAKQPGIVYRSLKDILGGGDEDRKGKGENVGAGTFVQVTMLEIYNEEIYDLLGNNGGGGGLGWTKGNNASKVRLEVIGKKAKNATFISGNEAGKISREIQKVEKRRIIKSTLCNERSSRSHCMVILDVPTVGGRLMLVDMAGSENIEQAGQIGFEAKMQTAKINQGNIALKRVVESIANGDSHVPFRDSKLTMLLQDSFEDDKSKILMILCASPDPMEIHKTLSTLEYGAKAKCIVRGPHTPIKGNTEDSASAIIFGSRIAAMDQFILKLQMEKKLKETECNEAHKVIEKKNEELAALRAKLEVVNVKGCGTSEHEIINLKVNEQTRILKYELEKKLEECKRMASEIVEIERRRMDERIEHEKEVERLRKRLEEVESDMCRLRDGNGNENRLRDSVGSNFAKRLLSVYADEDPGMVKSMDLDMGDDQEPFVSACSDVHSFAHKFSDRVCLSTVFEEEEIGEEGEHKGNFGDEEEEKEMIEEKRVVCSGVASDIDKPPSYQINVNDPGNTRDSDSSRQLRIENIFTLCGNQRELSHNIKTSNHVENVILRTDAKRTELASNENLEPSGINANGALIEVYVKWEAQQENPGKFITTLKVTKDASLADLRKLIEIYLGADNQGFSFLVLGDPKGAPVPKENEASHLAIKLPICNNQTRGYFACLRAAGGNQCSNNLPLSSIENKLPLTPVPHFTRQSDGLSPKKVVQNFSATPFINS